MTHYPQIVAAALAETASKFDLADALALEIPERPHGAQATTGRDGKGDDSVIARLEEARQRIIDAGGEDRSVATLKDYRKTALWVLAGSGGSSPPASGWVPGFSFSAHDAARRQGKPYAEFAANPVVSRNHGENEKAAVENRAAKVAKLLEDPAVAKLAEAKFVKQAEERAARAKVEAEEVKARALAAAEAAAVEKARRAAEQHEIQARKSALREVAAEGKEAGRARAESVITEKHLVEGRPSVVPTATDVEGLDAEEVAAFSEGFERGFIEIWNVMAREYQKRQNDKIVAERKVLEAQQAAERAEKAKRDAEARAAQQRDYSIESSIACLEENAEHLTTAQKDRLINVVAPVSS